MINIDCKLKGRPEEFLRVDQAIRTFQFVQNKCLALWMANKTLKVNGYTLNTYALKLRKDSDFPSYLNAQAAQCAAERTWQTITRFYKRMKNGTKPVGYPKFKKNNRSLEYTNQSGWKLKGNKLYITDGVKARFGLFNLKKLYSYPQDKIKRVRLIKRADGYYANFVLDINRSDPQPPTGKTVGLDVGLTHYLTDSEGNTVENPRFLEKSEKKLKRLQRKVSKKVKGSSNRKKAISKLARKHLKVSRQRKDFAVKLARCVVKSNDLVAVENLSVRNMMQNHKLAKSIGSVSWYTFRTWLEYYGKIFGKIVIAIDPRNTSQNCSGCDVKVPKTLKDRVHNCPSCGLILDRDHNAALNILKRGLSTVGHTGIYASGDEDLCIEQATASTVSLVAERRISITGNTN